MPFSINDRVKIIRAPLWTGHEGMSGYVNQIHYNFGVAHYNISLENGSNCDCIESELELYIPGEFEKKPKLVLPEEIQTLEEAVRYDLTKRRKYDTIGEQRIKDGLCPICGEKTFYHLSEAICKTHGVVS